MLTNIVSIQKKTKTTIIVYQTDANCLVSKTKEGKLMISGFSLSLSDPYTKACKHISIENQEKKIAFKV